MWVEGVYKAEIPQKMKQKSRELDCILMRRGPGYVQRVESCHEIPQ